MTIAARYTAPENPHSPRETIDGYRTMLESSNSGYFALLNGDARLPLGLTVTSGHILQTTTTLPNTRKLHIVAMAGRNP